MIKVTITANSPAGYAEERSLSDFAKDVKDIQQDVGLCMGSNKDKDLLQYNVKSKI